MGVFGAAGRGLLLAVALLLASCASIDSVMVVYSKAQNVRRVRLPEQSAPFLNWNRDVAEVDAGGTHFFVLDSWSRSLSETCVATFLIMPADLSTQNEKELNPHPVRFELDIGVQGGKAGTTVNLYAMPMHYRGRIYRPEAVSRIDAKRLIPSYHAVPGPVAVSPSGKITWYHIVFDLPDFNPANRFTLSIDGLTEHGWPVDTVPIHFVPEKKRETHDYGERGC